MIGPMKKGIGAAKLHTPEVGIYEGHDLRVLPEFICYKAALMKEKVVWQNVTLVVGSMLILVMLFSGGTISSLNERLRLKEYISLPDFVAVSPQSISDEEVQGFVDDFISKLGNYNASNVERNYEKISLVMSNELRMKFELESSDLISWVKEEKITETLTCKRTEIVEVNGIYKIVSSCLKETYVNREFLGVKSQIVEMEVRLLPPKKGAKPLQVIELQKITPEAFKAKASN
jgi:hypothetical protein